LYKLQRKILELIHKLFAFKKYIFSVSLCFLYIYLVYLKVRNHGLQVSFKKKWSDSYFCFSDTELLQPIINPLNEHYIEAIRVISRSVTNLDRKMIKSEKTTWNDVNGNNNCAFVVFYFESVARRAKICSPFDERIRINAKVNSSTAATGTLKNVCYQGLSFR